MAERPQIGWIGLGNMGSRMAPNLIKAGYDVTVFDVDPARMAELVAAGAKTAASPGELGAGCDVVVSMIPNDKVLFDIVAGADGLQHRLRPGACFIDMSTVSPGMSKQVAERLAAHGLSYLRAPVSGSTALAAAGTLAIFVSGDREAFDRHRPILHALGRKVTYLGAGEEARVTKLMINLIVGSINGALAEALNFGQRNGLDWATMIDTIADSVVASPYIASKVDKLKQRDWTAAAPISLIAKDADLALDLGRISGAFMPMTAIVRQTLSAMEGRGDGHLDMAAVVELFDAG
ncbi:MAG: NAD(P)-dependent oxidoreductase [Rhizobiales bacterium]|nr:NAD(P)-dependent oxidoreductase [Hyphomicrobiales bacterium]